MLFTSPKCSWVFKSWLSLRIKSGRNGLLIPGHHLRCLGINLRWAEQGSDPQIFELLENESVNATLWIAGIGTIQHLTQWEFLSENKCIIRCLLNRILRPVRDSCSSNLFWLMQVEGQETSEPHERYRALFMYIFASIPSNHLRPSPYKMIHHSQSPKCWTLSRLSGEITAFFDLSGILFFHPNVSLASLQLLRFLPLSWRNSNRHLRFLQKLLTYGAGPSVSTHVSALLIFLRILLCPLRVRVNEFIKIQCCRRRANELLFCPLRASLQRHNNRKLLQLPLAFSYV